MLKKLTLACAASVWMMGAASAADIEAVPEAYDWSGFYVGAQVGWNWLEDDQELQSPTFGPETYSHSYDDFLVGVHAGYDVQIEQIVLGLVVDGEYNGAKDDYEIGDPFVDTVGEQQLEWQGSVRAKLGFAFDRAMLYATGGLAVGEFEDNYNTSDVFVETVKNTRWGWTVGAGAAYALTDNLSASAEYRYTDWGSKSEDLDDFLAPPGTVDDEVIQHAVRLLLSYRF